MLEGRGLARSGFGPRGRRAAAGPLRGAGGEHRAPDRCRAPRLREGRGPGRTPRGRPQRPSARPECDACGLTPGRGWRREGRAGVRPLLSPGRALRRARVTAQPGSGSRAGGAAGREAGAWGRPAGGSGSGRAAPRPGAACRVQPCFGCPLT